MSKLDNHPTQKGNNESTKPESNSSTKLESNWIKNLAIDCGADDTGLVGVDCPCLNDQREEILSIYPWTKTLLSFVRRINSESLISTDRSIANKEFHGKGNDINEIGGKIVDFLKEKGVKAVNTSMGFPMDLAGNLNKNLLVSHKPIAVAAGLGHMGIHRNVIHPKFGSFILLGTVLIDAVMESYDNQIDYNPCFECNLCVAACPVGAISADGGFNFTACYTHNSAELISGGDFGSEHIIDFWQSLSFVNNYKSAYCISVCPAGEDVIGPYLEDRKAHFQQIVKPLQNKEENIYVIKGTDTEEIVKNRSRNKIVKNVEGLLLQQSIKTFVNSLPVLFQREKSDGLEAIFHFSFIGEEEQESTVAISGNEIHVSDGHVGDANVQVIADSRTWLDYISGNKTLEWAQITSRIKIDGPSNLFTSFCSCFPALGIKHEELETFMDFPLIKFKDFPYLRNDKTTGKFGSDIEESAKWSGNLKVDKIIDETPSVKTFKFVNPDGDTLPFNYSPGQFLTLTVFPGGKQTKRSYTIASTPTRAGSIEITVRREEFGLVSNYLHNEVKEGDSITITAPSGNFTFTGEEHKSIILIAGGVGITPMMSVVRYLCDKNWIGEIYLIISHRSPEEYIFRDEIENIESKHDNLHLLTTMSRVEGEDWSGAKGRINKEMINEFVQEITKRRIHICGPVSMMDSVKEMLAELQVSQELIKLENFGTDKRSPSAKKEGETGGVVGEIRFTYSDKSVNIHERETILEVAESVGIEIDNACRSGTCGSCKVKLISGSIEMDCDDALSKDEKSEGIILACQAVTQGNVEIDE